MCGLPGQDTIMSHVTMTQDARSIDVHSCTLTHRLCNLPCRPPSLMNRHFSWTWFYRLHHHPGRLRRAAQVLPVRPAPTCRTTLYQLSACFASVQETTSRRMCPRRATRLRTSSLLSRAAPPANGNQSVASSISQTTKSKDGGSKE